MRSCGLRDVGHHTATRMKGNGFKLCETRDAPWDEQGKHGDPHSLQGGNTSSRLCKEVLKDGTGRLWDGSSAPAWMMDALAGRMLSNVIPGDKRSGGIWRHKSPRPRLS